MQKRSHLLLARSLLADGRGIPARRYELAFLLGSFQPDCNPLSYLKGSLRCKPFGGHTYANSRAYIERHIRRLQTRRRWNLWNWYTFGKLTHYVADAFTWAHNPRFPGAALRHHAYETRLRVALEARLSAPDGRAPVRDDGASLAALHERYLAEARPGVETDISYILRASARLVADCRPATAKLGNFA